MWANHPHAFTGALGFLLVLVCCLTRAFRQPVVSISSTTLEWLQYNIANTWRYIQVCVTSLVITALLVSISPAILATQYSLNSQSNFVKASTAYYAAPLAAFHDGYYDLWGALRVFFFHNTKGHYNVHMDLNRQFLSLGLRTAVQLYDNFVPYLILCSPFWMNTLHLCGVNILVLYPVLYFVTIHHIAKFFQEALIEEVPDQIRMKLLRSKRKEIAAIRRKRALKQLSEPKLYLDKISLRRRQRRLQRKYAPQGAVTDFAMKYLQNEAYDLLATNKDLILREIEDAILLCVRLKDCKSWSGVMANIVSDVKKRFSSSLSGIVLQCIEDLFQESQTERAARTATTSDSFETQAGDMTPSESTWLSTLRTAHSNWKLATNNEGFDKISRLISLLVGAGMIQMTSLNVDVGGLNLFSELSVPKHVSAFDLADAAMSTVVYFVEGGYECLATGTMKPLLYGEHEMRKFDEDYLKCSRYADYARPGNLALLSIDENDLDALFNETLDLGKKLLKTTKSIMIRKHIQDRLVRLQDMQSKFTQFRQSGNLREKPYCIGIYGSSSVGKSTIGPLLMTSLLYFNGFKADDEATIVLNEHDKYMSNYKSSINGVFLDDVGNTKADYVETAPTVRILEMVNNVKMYANMAEAELKGKVSIQPKAVVCTTNTKDFCAHTYSNEPVSIARRANYIVTVSVRPQFATNNMLDEGKVFSYYGDEVPEIPDLWTFTVEKGYPIPSKTKGARDILGWKTLVWNGQVMKDIDIGTLLKFTNVDSHAHFTNQKKIVDKNSHLASKLTFCSDCRSHISQCVCDNVCIDKNGVKTYNSTVEYIESEHIPSPMTKQRARRRTPYQEKKPPRSNSPADLSKLPDSVLLGNDLPATAFENQAGIYRNDDWSVEAWKTYLSDWGTPTWNDVHGRIETLCDMRVVSWTSWLPADWFKNPIMRGVLAWFYGHMPNHVIFAHLLFPVFSLLLYGLLDVQLKMFICTFGLLTCFSYIYTYRCETELLVESIAETHTAEQAIIVERKSKVAYLLAGCAVLFGLYTLIKAVQGKRELFSTQGMMHPTQIEIDKRDATDLTSTIANEQNWANMHISPVPVSQKSKTTTFADLKNMAIGNTTFMEYVEDGKMFACDAFFVCSNVALIPRHAWKKDNMLCKFTRHDPSAIGGNFSSYVSRAHSVDIPDMDASLVWIANGGSWKDLRDYFPQENPKNNIGSEFLWKDHLGTVHRSPVLFTPQLVTNGFAKFLGGKYNLSFPSKVGMCMAPLVSETKSPFFAGFHLGGITGTPKGCAGTILRAPLDQAMAQLAAKSGVLIGMSAGTFDTQKYGVQFFEGSTVHEKSPLRKLPIIDGKTPNIEVFGSCMGRATYFSDVVTSYISACVTDVTGVPNKWGKPKFNKVDPWHTSLEHSCHPSHGFEGDLLSRAVDDYKKPFAELLAEYHALRDGTRPLTRMETICGIDGKKFVDKMPPSTSIGYPLGGPKSKFIAYLDPTMFEGFNCPAELDDIFWVEFEKAKAGYLNGERYYPAFKACLKDEPTKLDKDKVRVFQAAPIVLQMMTRMYFLPIVRILSLFPALSECAVGVNCMGPDWSELGKHMRHFGKDRILAGDYSKYDLRMPAQVMFAAFRILIDLSRLCGYSDEDVKIMKGIATDICYPVMAYNGDLIQHIGSNPSGQNLTVYINSVVNSLLFRCAFFDLKGLKCKTEFRDICKLMTYGDDVKGSVKPGYDDFNHLYVAKFFAAHDMKFTMPDKESVPTAFMSDTDADFLKRKNVYCSELGFTMGALDEDSIFKSLHSNLKSKAKTREQLAADNMDGALREWFNHGREIYETRRSQMQEIASRKKITHLCTQLDKDFDFQINHWRERYIDPPSENEVVEEVFSVQSGCYVSQIIPVFNDVGEIVNSINVIDCGYPQWPQYVIFVLFAWAAYIITGLYLDDDDDADYTVQANVYRAGGLRPRPRMLPPRPRRDMFVPVYYPLTWEQFLGQYVQRRIHENAKHAAMA